jgi:hypothetical protein
MDVLHFDGFISTLNDQCHFGRGMVEIAGLRLAQYYFLLQLINTEHLCEEISNHSRYKERKKDGRKIYLVLGSTVGPTLRASRQSQFASSL